MLAMAVAAAHWGVGAIAAEPAQVRRDGPEVGVATPQTRVRQEDRTEPRHDDQSAVRPSGEREATWRPYIKRVSVYNVGI
jgi:hypothetical protein